jgi:hypothetical protein
MTAKGEEETESESITVVRFGEEGGWYLLKL